MTLRIPPRWKVVIVAAASALVVATIGGTLTDIGPWYQNLRFPAWKPPDAAFGPIWTVIFTLTATAAVIAWRHERTEAGHRWLIALFAANGSLNVLWTVLFFQMKRPDWALIEVVVFWLSILVLLIALYRRSSLAGALLAPYLIWVSAASLLNYQIVTLNGPFG